METIGLVQLLEDQAGQTSTFWHIAEAGTELQAEWDYADPDRAYDAMSGIVWLLPEANVWLGRWRTGNETEEMYDQHPWRVGFEDLVEQMSMYLGSPSSKDLTSEAMGYTVTDKVGNA